MIRTKVKKEYAIILSCSAGSIIIKPSLSHYLLLPKEIVKELLNCYDLDFESKKVDITCHLVEDESTGAVSVIYKFRKKEEGL